MNKIVTILLLSLLSNHFTGLLTGSDIRASGLFSLDKIFKLLVLTMAFTVLLFRRTKFSIPRDIWIYVLLGVFILLPLLLNHLYSNSSDDFCTFDARKELIRLSILLIFFLLCATASSKSSDYRTLVYSFAIAGLFLSILSIHRSLTGEIEEHWYYVRGYLRAGYGITGPNSLGAVLNITSVAALAAYFLANKSRTKVLFLSILVIIQGARFATFSTGSFLSFIITVVAAIYLLKKYHTKMLKPFLKISVFIVFLLFIFILGTGLFTTVFYRVLLSDDAVKGASIYSRLDQYKGYIELIKREPTSLICGVGTADLPAMLGTNLNLHNSYLRPLAAGGIVAFVCFLFLWWRCLKDFVFSIKTSQENEVHRIVSIFFFASFIGWSFQAATIPSDTSTIQWFFFIIAYLLRRSASTLPTSRVPRQQRSFRPVYV